MLVLFDNGTPRGLARFLIGHSVQWPMVKLVAAINAAEGGGYLEVVKE
jgi:hypothetical protein